MKKIAFTTFILLAAFSSVQAAEMDKAAEIDKAKMDKAALLAAVKHAHPLPNLMRIIVDNQDQLGLSAEQKQAVADWIKKHRPIVTELAMSIKEGEQTLHDSALNCAAKEGMMAKLEELLNKRRKMAVLKMECLETMHQLLGYEKWQQVLELYKNM